MPWEPYIVFFEEIQEYVVGAIVTPGSLQLFQLESCKRELIDVLPVIIIEAFDETDKIKKFEISPYSYVSHNNGTCRIDVTGDMVSPATIMIGISFLNEYKPVILSESITFSNPKNSQKHSTTKFIDAPAPSISGKNHHDSKFTVPLNSMKHKCCIISVRYGYFSDGQILITETPMKIAEDYKCISKFQ